MSIRREYEQKYASFWRSLRNFLLNNTNMGVSGVARAGSRRAGTHRNTSDLDVIFAISGDPNKQQIYPKLVELLRQGFNVQADIGRSYNVINIWKEGISCDLVLRGETHFRTQVQSQRYRED